MKKLKSLERFTGIVFIALCLFLLVLAIKVCDLEERLEKIEINHHIQDSITNSRLDLIVEHYKNELWLGRDDIRIRPDGLIESRYFRRNKINQK